ncbi:MAG: outer membrane protein assembly factor BamD [Nannocystaceae bacterium]|nr:outer membrane protein assembly factor BamD [Nannocystaceae bacterium]
MANGSTARGARRWRAAARRGLALAGWLAIAQAPACKTGPDLSADYAQTAEENFAMAQSEFEDRDFEEAIQYADFVRIRFPFSRYAVEAELLIARAEFEQGNHTTAMDAFKQFAKLHPTHEHVRNGWASFMAAASAYMNAPQKFFLLPPDHMRDQSQLQDALIELEYYFDHYAGTVTERYAVKLRDEVRRRLLKHELYVANFYLSRDKPEAAIGRLETAHATYPGIGLDAEVLFLLGLTYLRMDEIELARSTFTELLTQHPKHHHGKQARIYLRYIRETYGPADPSRKRPDRSPPKPVPPPKPKNLDNPVQPERGKPSRPEGTLAPPSSPPKSPFGGTPEGGTPEGGAPEGGTPEGGTPEGGAPEGGTPEGGTPEGGTPEGGAPEGGAPEGGAPEGGAPEGGSPPEAGTGGTQSPARAGKAATSGSGATTGTNPN